MRTLSSQAVPDIDRLNASLAAQFQRRPSEHLVVAGAVALLGHKWGAGRYLLRPFGPAIFVNRALSVI